MISKKLIFFMIIDSPCKLCGVAANTAAKLVNIKHEALQ